MMIQWMKLLIKDQYITIIKKFMKKYISVNQESVNTTLKSNFKMTSSLLKSIKFFYTLKINRILIISQMDFMNMNMKIIKQLSIYASLFTVYLIALKCSQSFRSLSLLNGIFVANSSLKLTQIAIIMVCGIFF